VDIWVLWHIPPEAEGTSDYFLIGLYSSREASIAAVKRLAGQPGFADDPDVVDDTESPGFFTEAYTVDQDHWPEGYMRSSD
jgi:hypothetical protein